MEVLQEKAHFKNHTFEQTFCFMGASFFKKKKKSQQAITPKTLLHASLLQTASLSRLCIYTLW